MKIYLIAFIGFLAMAVTFVTEIIYLRKQTKKLPARVEKAKALGHEVKAYKTKEWHTERRYESNQYIDADYRYEVNGKTYRYNYHERLVPPASITLYYIHNPKKAFWGYSKTIGQKTNMLITYLLPLIVFVVVVLVLLKF